jgi:hypothetical protein
MLWELLHLTDSLLFILADLVACCELLVSLQGGKAIGDYHRQMNSDNLKMGER